MGVHYNANYTSVSQVKGPSGFYNIDILGNNTKQFVYVNQDYDGVLLGTATYRSAANNTNLTIGGTTDTYMWNGNISNFTIYNRALTAAEIQQNYNALKGRFSI